MLYVYVFVSFSRLVAAMRRTKNQRGDGVAAGADGDGDATGPEDWIGLQSKGDGDVILLQRKSLHGDDAMPREIVTHLSSNPNNLLNPWMETQVHDDEAEIRRNGGEHVDVGAVDAADSTGVVEATCHPPEIRPSK